MNLEDCKLSEDQEGTLRRYRVIMMQIKIVIPDKNKDNISNETFIS